MGRAADPVSRCEVDEALDKAAALNLTVIRTWAFSDGGAAWRALQHAPGRYDEATFAGLDYVVAAAGARGLRVLLAFGARLRRGRGVGVGVGGARAGRRAR